MDPIVEISDRCHRLLACRILMLDDPNGTPYKEVKVGRVYIYEQEEALLVHLHRLVQYTCTSDMVYSEYRRQHKYSSWPLVHDALVILRTEMILDDIARS